MKIGDTIKFGKYGGGAIEFEVKDIFNDNALLVSKYVIDCKIFSSKREIKPESNDRNYRLSEIQNRIENNFGNRYYINGNRIENREYEIITDYAKSDIRQWLNNEFYNTAFNEDEKAKIQTYLKTDDKVFILSKEECEKYFPFKQNRMKKGTEYAISNGLKVFYKTGCAYYYLRSAYSSNRVFMVENTGAFTNYVPNYKDGVVPALIIKI